MPTTFLHGFRTVQVALARHFRRYVTLLADCVVCCAPAGNLDDQSVNAGIVVDGNMSTLVTGSIYSATATFGAVGVNSTTVRNNAFLPSNGGATSFVSKASPQLSSGSSPARRLGVAACFWPRPSGISVCSLLRRKGQELGEFLLRQGRCGRAGVVYGNCTLGSGLWKQRRR